jgi:hypothetical protein
MPNPRLYYDNLLTLSRFSAFQVAGGATAQQPASFQIAPYNGGTVLVTTGGAYTGVIERDYLIEVTSSTDGTFPNTRWRWSDSGGVVWNQENLIPISGTPVSMSFGLTITFTTSGPGPQFVTGDFWVGRALLPYGIGKALDGQRDTEYRSGTLPSGSTLSLGFDLGSAQTPQAFFAADANWPSNATMTWRAHATTLFQEPAAFTQAVTVRTSFQAELMTGGAFRYWWLRIILGGTALTYLRLSELFLGQGTSLAQAPTIGYDEEEQFLTSIDFATLVRGTSPRRLTDTRPVRTWSLIKRDVSGDGGKLATALQYAARHPSFRTPPFWFIPWDADLNTVEYNVWETGIRWRHRFLERWDATVDWPAVLRTAE